MTRCAARAGQMSLSDRPYWRGAAAQVQRWLHRFRDCYLQGVWVIRPALLNCLLTCLGGAFANLLYEGWNQDGWTSLSRRICVGYLGAVCVVLLVLPWLGRRVPAK